MRALDLRGFDDFLDPWRFHRAAEEDHHFQKTALRPDEEVTGLAREHDRVVRGVNALLPELDRGVAQPLVRVLQIVGQILASAPFRSSSSSRAASRLPPMLAVVALVPLHRLALSHSVQLSTGGSKNAGPFLAIQRGGGIEQCVRQHSR